MELVQKLAILSDAAKYDASCASSGTTLRDSVGGKGIGSTSPGMGICHSYAPDGRCISLLKILLTNWCVYDCLYCVNRHSSHVRRARFTVEEVVDLTLGFYRRNYIEGLFLSSGVIRNPDYTMEQLMLVAKTLREEHHFQGYIHLKTIPDADERLIEEAGRYADRLSINIEMPSEAGLAQLAPEKNRQTIHSAMGVLKSHIDESREDKRLEHRKASSGQRLPAKQAFRSPARRTFSPAGQSTQMIVGADDANDHLILRNSDALYRQFRMRRVYYSAFSPIPDSSAHLPLKAPPLIREHRLYQADWLMRFYGFNVTEIVDPKEQAMLDLDIDPKLAWALRNRDLFPMDVNRASREQLLRIPGLGPRGVQKILKSRHFRRLRLEDLKRMRVSLQRVKPFIITADYRPASADMDGETLRQKLRPQAQTEQLSLFGAA